MRLLRCISPPLLAAPSSIQHVPKSASAVARPESPPTPSSSAYLEHTPTTMRGFTTRTYTMPSQSIPSPALRSPVSLMDPHHHRLVLVPAQALVLLQQPLVNPPRQQAHQSGRLHPPRDQTRCANSKRSLSTPRRILCDPGIIAVSCEGWPSHGVIDWTATTIYL